MTSVGVSSPVGAQVERPDRGLPERGPAVATFEGRSIDLSQDWGDARACLVWRQGGVVECFRTPDALGAREAQLDLGGERRLADAKAASSWSCASPLRLYDYTYYSGRQLSFWDRGYWQNLWDYGFDDRTSSYIIGACYSYLAEHGNGGGWWYPGPDWPYAGVPVMEWGWSNTISSIYIA